MHIDDEFRILGEDVYRLNNLSTNEKKDKLSYFLYRVVDLCAAPGSWSQVLARRLIQERQEEDKKRTKIVAVDLQGDVIV